MNINMKMIVREDINVVSKIYTHNCTTSEAFFYESVLKSFAGKVIDIDTKLTYFAKVISESMRIQFNQCFADDIIDDIRLDPTVDMYNIINKEMKVIFYDLYEKLKTKPRFFHSLSGFKEWNKTNRPIKIELYKRLNDTGRIIVTYERTRGEANFESYDEMVKWLDTVDKFHNVDRIYRSSKVILAKTDNLFKGLNSLSIDECLKLKGL